MVMKANERMERRMEATEKAIEENCEAVESRLSSIEGMIQRLVAAWEKQSPESNVHANNSIGGNKGNVTHGRNRWRTIEKPIFEGEDPMGWLTKIDHQSQAVREDKLEAVMVAMDGEALGWFQW